MSKKVPIIIIVILLLVIVLLLFVFKKDLKNNSKVVSNYMIIGNDSIWKYTNKWESSYYSDVDNNKMNVYVDNIYKGEYVLKYGNGWNLFLNDKYQQFSGSLIALSNNFGNVLNVDINEIDDNDIIKVNEILHSNYVKSNFSLMEKVNVDLDNNGVLDKIVNVSNLDIEDEDKYFNLVYIILNNKVYVLKKEIISKENYYNAPIYNIKVLVKFSDYTNIVISKGYFSDAGKSGNIMYEKVNGKYELVIED